LVRPRFVISAIAPSIWASRVSTSASACDCASIRAASVAASESTAPAVLIRSPKWAATSFE